MSLVTFAVAAVVLAVTPGPGIAYVVARTVAGGRSEGLASCLGTGLGGLIHVAAAALGLSLLVAKSAVAFSVLKYLGAFYLLYLGVRALLNKNLPAHLGKLQPHGAGRALLDGAIVEALNVKTALFFIAFLPQFISSDAALAPQMVALGSICVLLNTSVDVFAVLGVNRLLASEALRTTRARALTRASGLTMLCLGGILLLTRRAS